MLLYGTYEGAELVFYEVNMTENIPYTSDERVKEMLELVEALKVAFKEIAPKYQVTELLRIELLIKKEYESNVRRPS